MMPEALKQTAKVRGYIEASSNLYIAKFPSLRFNTDTTRIEAQGTLSDLQELAQRITHKMTGWTHGRPKVSNELYDKTHSISAA